jgi:hypothetical protein
LACHWVRSVEVAAPRTVSALMVALLSRPLV